MRKSLLKSLSLVSATVAASPIAGKSLGKTNNLLTSNAIGSKNLQKQISSSKTIGLLLKTKRGFTTISGPAMKKVLKLHSKSHNSKIVGTIIATKKGMNAYVSKSFATSKHFTSSKHVKLSSSNGQTYLTSGSWNKKIVKNPLAMTKTSKTDAYTNTAAIKLSSGSPRFFKI